MPPHHVEHAFAKLTRTLRIVGRRDDGYHLIEAEMIAVDFGDVLEIVDGSEGFEVLDEIDWQVGRGPWPELEIPLDSSNLVLRALEAAGASASVRLRKHVPAGAGLGGGSSDAAAVLRHFGCFDEASAARLGADVPFCLRGGRAMVEGVGERLVPIADIEAAFVIVTPPFGVATVAVYAAFDEIGVGRDGDPNNDLASAASTVDPRLVTWSDAIAAVAGERPTLAGSGSSLFIECLPASAQGLAAELVGALTSEFGSVLVTPCAAVGRLGSSD